MQKAVIPKIVIKPPYNAAFTKKGEAKAMITLNGTRAKPKIELNITKEKLYCLISFWKGKTSSINFNEMCFKRNKKPVPPIQYIKTLNDFGTKP